MSMIKRKPRSSILDRSGWTKTWRSHPDVRLTVLCLALTAVLPEIAETTPRPANEGDSWRTLSASLAAEAGASMRRGAFSLIDQQADNGSWNDDLKATALSLAALVNLEKGAGLPTEEAVDAGRSYLESRLLALADSDNTEMKNEQPLTAEGAALAAMALMRLSEDNEQAAEIFQGVREFLFSLQQISEKHEESHNFGGFANSPGEKANLLTTQWALEALALIDLFDSQRGFDNALEKYESRYEAAWRYLKQCQAGTADHNVQNKTKSSAFIGAFMPDPKIARDQSAREDLPAVQKSPVVNTLAGVKLILYRHPEKNSETALSSAIHWLNDHWQKPDLAAATEEENFFTTAFFLAQTMPLLEKRQTAEVGGILRGWRVFTVTAIVGRQTGDGSWAPANKNQGLDQCTVVATACAVMVLQRSLE